MDMGMAVLGIKGKFCFTKSVVQKVLEMYLGGTEKYQWDWWRCTWEVRWKVGKVVLVILRWPERKMGHPYLLVSK